MVRHAVVLVVLVALTVVGLRAAQRITGDEPPAAVTASAAAVAEAWATDLAAGDVEGLAALAADRSDVDELRALHTSSLPALGGLRVEVTRVTARGNAGTAELALAATPVEGGTWDWTTQLELIRGRGRWSVDWDPTALHPQLRPGWRLAVETVPGTRAAILDREGRPLSRTGGVVEIGVQPGRLPDRQRVLLVVAEALPEAFEPLRQLLDRDDLRPDWYYPLLTVPTTTADEAWPELLSVPGFLRRDAEAATGPAVAAVDIVGATERDDAGDVVGVDGLERVLDDRLDGAASSVVRLVDPDGGDRGVLHGFQQTADDPVVTTLHLDVQRVVDEVVDEAVGDRDIALGVVAVHPGSGGILAATSRPATGYARALEGRYPAALVAAVVPVAAALAEGSSPDAPVDCPRRGEAAGITVTTLRPSDREQRPLTDALAGDCDVGLARLGASLGAESLADAASLLGLGMSAELPVPAATSAWPATPSDAAVASAAIGHGPVRVSALTAATLAATVARGEALGPSLLAGEEVVGEPVATPVVAGLRAAMRTAGADGPVRTQGVRVAGIATAAGRVSGDPTPPTGWWVGWLEGDAPDLALAVVVEGDDDGSRAAVIADAIVERVTG